VCPNSGSWETRPRLGSVGGAHRGVGSCFMDGSAGSRPLGQDNIGKKQQTKKKITRGRSVNIGGKREG